jgi:hypothetical protein
LHDNALSGWDKSAICCEIAELAAATHRPRDEHTTATDHRSGCRQGRAHALGPAEGAAPHRRTLDAGACAGDRPGGWRRPAGAGRRARHGGGARRSKAVAPDIEIFEQANQAGTADAVLAARPALESHRGDVTVLFADTPLVEVATLRKLSETLQAVPASPRSASSRPMQRATAD